MHIVRYNMSYFEHALTAQRKLQCQLPSRWDTFLKLFVKFYDQKSTQLIMDSRSLLAWFSFFFFLWLTTKIVRLHFRYCFPKLEKKRITLNYILSQSSRHWTYESGIVNKVVRHVRRKNIDSLWCKNDISFF